MFSDGQLASGEAPIGADDMWRLYNEHGPAIRAAVMTKEALRLSTGEVEEISHELRNEILGILEILETENLVFEHPTEVKEAIKVLWGKVAFLNGQLGLKHPETAIRYGKHSKS